MVYGGVDHELIWLSEGSVWSGPPRRPEPHPAPAQAAGAAIAAARPALAAKDPVAAERALHALQHSSPQSFRRLARLRRTSGPAVEPAPAAEVVPAADADAVEDPAADQPYHRILDLRSATAWTRAGAVRQSAFVSAPHQVLVVEVSGTAGPVSFTLDSPLRPEQTGAAGAEAWALPHSADDVVPAVQREADPVRWSDPPRGVQAAVAVQAVGAAVRTRCTPDGLVLDVDGEATLVLAVSTTFTRLGADPSQDPGPPLERARQRCRDAVAAGLDRVHAEHVADHRALYDRAELRLGKPDEAGPADCRTRTLIDASDAAGARADSRPALVSLLFSYGRYLLISSSRPGGTPANLQGVWNQQMQPPWSSNFTMNINLERSEEHTSELQSRGHLVCR